MLSSMYEAVVWVSVPCKSDWRALSCSPSTWEGNSGKLEIQDHLQQYESETGLSCVKPCLNNKIPINKPKTGKGTLRAGRQGRWLFARRTTTGLFCISQAKLKSLFCHPVWPFNQGFNVCAQGIPFSEIYFLLTRKASSTNILWLSHLMPRLPPFCRTQNPLCFAIQRGWKGDNACHFLQTLHQAVLQHFSSCSVAEDRPCGHTLLWRMLKHMDELMNRCSGR